MPSLDSLKVRSLLKRGVIQTTTDDTPIGIRLRYIGTGTVTSVTNIIATSTTLITSDGGTDAYAFATYTTLGALADAINADGIFEAKVMDALRSDASASTFIGTTITAGTDENGVRVWDLKMDTSAVKALTVLLSNTRNFNVPSAIANSHRVVLEGISYNANINAASVNGVVVYMRVGTIETQVYGATSVDATTTNITWASGLGYISSVDGGELIVRVQDSTSLTDATANFISAIGFQE
jgi:hypothetical protein